MWVPAPILALAVLHAAASPQPGTVLHVSPRGRDTWAGTARRPLATPVGALARVRALRREGPHPQPVTITLHSGVYRLGRPLLLTPEDSGTPGAPLVIAAEPGARPVLSAAHPISGWRRAGPAWRARIPDALRRVRFRQLFLNGARLQRARSPNTGFFRVDGAVENVWTWGRDGAREDARPSRFRYRGAEFRREWADPGDVETVLLQVWAEARLPVRAVDPVSSTVTLGGTCSPSNREADARYWVENAASCLDAPGEWHADFQTGTVTLIAPPGVDPRRARVEASAERRLLTLQGVPSAGRLVHDVAFRGITFFGTDWEMPAGGYVNVQSAFDVRAAVTGDGAERVRFEACRFAGLGAWAVHLGRGCRDNLLDRCVFEDLGAGAVKLGEFVRRPDPRDRSSGNVVSRCRVRRIGLVYPGAAGIWLGQTSGCRVSRCEITDAWSTGISVGWSWGDEPSLAQRNVIERNHVHHIGRFDELGGVYTLGAQPGTVIRGNHVHEIRSRAGWGIYLDEGSSGITVEANLVHHTTAAGFMLHYGRDNVVRGNVFALSDHPNVLLVRQAGPRSLTFVDNIVLCTGGLPLDGALSQRSVSFDRNVYWTTANVGLRFGAWTIAEWRARGQDTRSVIADPLFVDAARGDFRFRPGSLAAAMGIRSLDLRLVGP